MNYVKAYRERHLSDIEWKIEQECKEQNAEPVSVSLIAQHEHYSALVVFRKVEA